MSLIQAGLGVGGLAFSSLPKPEHIRYGSDVQSVLLAEQSTNKVSFRTAQRQRAAKITTPSPSCLVPTPQIVTNPIHTTLN